MTYTPDEFQAAINVLKAAQKETVALRDKRITELEVERDRLREALERYSVHDTDCYLRVGSLNPGMRDIKCDCGLVEALNKEEVK